MTVCMLPHTSAVLFLFFLLFKFFEQGSWLKIKTDMKTILRHQLCRVFQLTVCRIIFFHIKFETRIDVLNLRPIES